MSQSDNHSDIPESISSVPPLGEKMNPNAKSAHSAKAQYPIETIDNAFSDLLILEDETLKVEQQNAALLVPKERWQGSVFGENWKEENNRLQVRLAPVKAAMADIIAGYTPSFPLDERMKSVLELSPYTVDQVTVNGEISKNLYLELLGSSRYYNPKYIAHITASRGDALLRESIFAYSDLLMLENETLKVEQQNTALLAVIASTAINARTEERLKEAAQGVANH